MKKLNVILLILLLVVGLFSCTAPEEVHQQPEGQYTYKRSYDYVIQDPALMRTQDRYEFFIETENYYYYLHENKVYFSTKNDPAFYLLCGKPDCSHGGTDCNAYAGWALGWWNGKLYGVITPPDSDIYLFSMEEDGSDHQVVATVQEPLSNAGSYGGTYTFFFHNGYFYYYVQNEQNSFFSVDLCTGVTTKLLEEQLKDGSEMYRWCGVEEELYFFLQDVEQKVSICRLSGTEMEILCDWELNTARWDIEKDKVCFYSADYQAFCEYDLTTGVLAEQQSFSASNGAAYYDMDFIYLVTWEDSDKGRNVYVFDRNYQLLEEIELTSAQDFLYATGDKLFFSGMPSNPITYYIPKSAIGTGELELIEVTNPYSYR